MASDLELKRAGGPCTEKDLAEMSIGRRPELDTPIVIPLGSIVGP